MRILLLILLLTGCREVLVTFGAPEKREDGRYISPEELAYCEILYGDSYNEVYTARIDCSDESATIHISDRETFVTIRAFDRDGNESTWHRAVIVQAAD